MFEKKQIIYSETQGTEEMKKDEKLRQAVEYVLGKKEG